MYFCKTCFVREGDVKVKVKGKIKVNVKLKENIKLRLKVKLKVTLEQAKSAHRRSICIDLPI